MAHELKKIVCRHNSTEVWRVWDVEVRFERHVVQQHGRSDMDLGLGPKDGDDASVKESVCQLLLLLLLLPMKERCELRCGLLVWEANN